MSDASLDELHAFADANEIPRRGFQGDHYDIPEEFRSALIEAGATVVESRELLRRLKAAGLRLTPTQRRAASVVAASAAQAADEVTSAAPHPTGRADT